MYRFPFSLDFLLDFLKYPTYLSIRVSYANTTDESPVSVSCFCKSSFLGYQCAVINYIYEQ